MTMKSIFCTPAFIVSLMLIISFAPQTQAATLTLPKDIELLFHNKHKYNSFSFGRKIELNAGQHQLVMRYNKLFERGGEHTEVHSEPIILEFQVAAADELTMKVPQFHHKNQAKQFAKSPNPQLLNNKQQKHSFKLHMLAPYSGFSFNRNILAEVTLWETEYQSTAPSTPPSKEALLEKKKLAQHNKNEDTALEMLKFWYDKSDTTTQQQFKLWIEQKKE